MNRHGFTLVELLMVVGIATLLMAVGMSVPKADRRRTAVEAAARELAATLRLARSMAIEKQSQYAVSFNITNGKGTSGQVLNNWTGGHWYQIVEPDEDTLITGGLAQAPTADFSDSMDVPQHLRRVSKCWHGRRSVLAARKVRFLALADQDNGTIRATGAGFPATYPRPWFGWYAAGRIHPWGGYDSARSGATPMINAAGRACSGFWYEGLDGAISGSVSPADRDCSINTSTSYRLDQTAQGMRLFGAGESRPLVNGDWLDACIRFQPDGTVTYGPAFQARWMSYLKRNTATSINGGGGAVANHGDLGDLTPAVTAAPSDWSACASHFNGRTGYWYITLAPDAERDDAGFASAAEALRAQSPMFRVGINTFGDVRVVAVKPSLPDGAVIDASMSPSDWQTGASVQARYARHVLTESGGQPRGEAFTDAVVPAMLETRGMWRAP